MHRPFYTHRVFKRLTKVFPIRTEEPGPGPRLPLAGVFHQQFTHSFAHQVNWPIHLHSYFSLLPHWITQSNSEGEGGESLGTEGPVSPV